MTARSPHEGTIRRQIQCWGWRLAPLDRCHPGWGPGLERDQTVADDPGAVDGTNHVGKAGNGVVTGPANDRKPGSADRDRS